MKEFLEYIARGLVEKPDEVTVEIDEEDDDEIASSWGSTSATWGA